MSASSVAVCPDTEQELVEEREASRKPRRQPRYHVILWDDDDHSYGYVIAMMQELFGYTKERGFQLAEEVDTRGRAVCLTTTLEHAELKRDQIRSYGKDYRMAMCQGAMSCTIEPER